MRVWLSPRPRVERGPSAAAQVKRPRHNTGPNQPLRTLILERLIIPVIVKDSLAQIAPAETAIGRPTATAHRLVDASVSDNTRRACAGAIGQLDAWLDGLRLDDADLAAYLREGQDPGPSAPNAAEHA